ncbi:MAG: RNA polymerase sigma factor [Planctomycetia bacterium]
MQTLLLPRIAAGDQSAVPECLARYGGLVWTLARRRLGNAEDAEDAVQDVFIDLWRFADRFDPGISEEITFVAMIARRRLVDRLRSRARQPVTASLDESEVAGAAASGDVDVVRRLELSEEARIAGEQFRGLKPEEQTVLRLSIYDSLSHAAIATRTGLPLGTVKSHIRRGLDSLRKAIAVRRGGAAAARMAGEGET